MLVQHPSTAKREPRARGRAAWRPLTELASAAGFLTRLPIRGSATNEPSSGAAAFAIVGAAIGSLAAVPLLVLGSAHPLLAAILAIAIVAAVGGGLHLDGLGDTLDALVAPAGAAERARLDPRAGTAGVVAIVVVLAIDAAALAELAARSGAAAATAIVLATACSRGAAPAAAVIGRASTSPSSGLGSWFATSTSGRAAATSAASAALLLAASGLIAGFAVPGAAILGIVLGAGFTAALVNARGQLDGDGFGTLIELTFASILVALAVVA